MSNLESQILKWFACGETGMSSKAMARVACRATCGLIPMDASHPYDPDDLNRCIKLVFMAPAIREEFHMIATLSDTWKRIIDRWDELEKTFIDEVGINWSKGRSAPITYSLMQEILHPKGN